MSSFFSAFNDNLLRYILLFWGSAKLLNKASIDSNWAFVVSMVFLVPFILLSGYGGFFADKYPKRNVFIATRALELFNLIFIWAACIFDNIFLGVGALFITTSISAIIGPSKYSFMPEIVNEEDISNLNALVELSNTIAISGATVLGGWLYYWHSDSIYMIGRYFSILILLGFLFSLGITKLDAKNPKQEFHFNPFHEVINGGKLAYNKNNLWRYIMGTTWFWYLGALLSLVLPKHGMDCLGLHQGSASFLNLYFAFGTVLGSFLAGKWSNNRIELGSIPFGLCLITFSSCVLGFNNYYIMVTIAIFLFGFGIGVYVIPINSILQIKAPPKDRGKIMAVNSFVSLLAVCVAFITFFILSSNKIFNLSTKNIFMVVGVMNICIFLLLARIQPNVIVRSVIWTISNIFLRIRVFGEENIEKKKGVIFVSNHLSYFDGFVVSSILDKQPVYMIWHKYLENKVCKWILSWVPTIATGSKPSIAKKSVTDARNALQRNESILIYPEGQISRSGHMLPFKRGIEKIIQDQDIQIVPIYIDCLWSNKIMNRNNKRSIWRFLRILPVNFNIVFGKPINSKVIKNAEMLRKEVKTLEAKIIKYRRNSDDVLPNFFIKSMKRNLFRKSMIADEITKKGTKLNGLKTLAGSLIFANLIRKLCDNNEEKIAIIIPPTVGGTLINVATSIIGITPINLNFSIGNEMMQLAIDQCNIKTVITSKKVWTKLSINLKVEKILFVEDLRKKISTISRIKCLLQSLLLSSKMLWKIYNTKNITPDSTATILFSSGTTGIPKGVVLTHHNIISNIEQIMQIFPHNKNFKILSTLPYFHSFGYTIGMWMPFLFGIRSVYHPILLDVKNICDIIKKHKINSIISVPNFYNMALKLAKKEDLTTLRIAVSGAAKLSKTTYEHFKEKFGINILEGYGCTELSPVISVNMPDIKCKENGQAGQVFGSVGKLVPGILTKIVDHETFKEVPDGQEGLLLLKGENKMQKYLHLDNKKTFIDGWYNTGDIVKIENDFIYLVDRISRFSKIGGEMVPHLKIEEAMDSCLNPGKKSIVSFIMDNSGAEKIAAVYDDMEITPDDLNAKLLKSNLPKLWIPKSKFLLQEESLPVLGSGKHDLKKIKEIIQAKISLGN